MLGGQPGWLLFITGRNDKLSWASCLGNAGALWLSTLLTAPIETSHIIVSKWICMYILRRCVLCSMYRVEYT